MSAVVAANKAETAFLEIQLLEIALKEERSCVHRRISLATIGSEGEGGAGEGVAMRGGGGREDNIFWVKAVGGGAITTPSSPESVSGASLSAVREEIGE